MEGHNYNSLEQNFAKLFQTLNLFEQKVTLAFVQTSEQIGQTNERISQLERRMGQFEGRMARMNLLNTRMNGGMGQLEEQMGRLDQRVEGIFLEIVQSEGRIIRQMNRRIDGEINRARQEVQQQIQALQN